MTRPFCVLTSLQKSITAGSVRRNTRSIELHNRNPAALSAISSNTVTSSGLIDRPDLVYTVRIYDDSPFGDIDVQVHNRTSNLVNVQTIRSLNASGQNLVNLGAQQTSERVLSDWFTENRVKVYDLGGVPQGLHFAIGSQLIYNRESQYSLLFGALNANRFVTAIRLQVDKQQNGPAVKFGS